MLVLVKSSGKHERAGLILSSHVVYRPRGSRRRVQAARRRSLRPLLLPQLLLELGKLVHRDLLLLVHHLINTLDFLDLRSSVPLNGHNSETHIMHEH